MRIRSCLGNGWGDGDFSEIEPNVGPAIAAFEDWLEDRFAIRFANRIVPSRKPNRP